TYANLTASVDWGDGSQPSPGIISSPQFAAAGLLTMAATYAGRESDNTTGSFGLKISIMNTISGATAVGHSTLLVRGQLVASGITFQATQGVALRTVIAGFVDQNLDDTYANLTASVDWGDGSQPSPGIISSPQFAFGPGLFTVA